MPFFPILRTFVTPLLASCDCITCSARPDSDGHVITPFMFVCGRSSTLTCVPLASVVSFLIVLCSALLVTVIMKFPLAVVTSTGVTLCSSKVLLTVKGSSTTPSSFGDIVYFFVISVGENGDRYSVLCVLGVFRFEFGGVRIWVLLVRSSLD